MFLYNKNGCNQKKSSAENAHHSHMNWLKREMVAKQADEIQIYTNICARLGSRNEDDNEFLRSELLPDILIMEFYQLHRLLGFHRSHWFTSGYLIFDDFMWSQWTDGVIQSNTVLVWQQIAHT